MLLCMSASSAPAIDIVTDPARAAAVLSPLRRTLLSRLAEGPDSATGLANALGEPRQRINYHLRELEKARYVTLHEERRRGNCVERVVKASAQYYLIDPTALGPVAADPDAIRDRFSAAYLVALAARTIRELAGLMTGAQKARKRLATFSLQTEVTIARPVDMRAFADDLTRAVADVVARHHDETTSSGQRFRLVIGSYPTPPKEKPDERGKDD
jgi:DNA-binding transcriptional ArsR family regulator